MGAGSGVFGELGAGYGVGGMGGVGGVCAAAALMASLANSNALSAADDSARDSFLSTSTQSASKPNFSSASRIAMRSIVPQFSCGCFIHSITLSGTPASFAASMQLPGAASSEHAMNKIIARTAAVMRIQLVIMSRRGLQPKSTT